jgi:hypothetical protein
MSRAAEDPSELPTAVHTVVHTVVHPVHISAGWQEGVQDRVVDTEHRWWGRCIVAQVRVAPAVAVGVAEEEAAVAYRIPWLPMHIPGQRAGFAEAEGAGEMDTRAERMAGQRGSLRVETRCCECRGLSHTQTDKSQAGCGGPPLLASC